MTDWKALASAKRAARDSCIPKEWLLPSPPSSSIFDVTEIPKSCGILSDNELQITETPAVVILERIRDKVWTAVQVTTAFCKRAAIAHQLVNCCTEILFERALSRAQGLDSHYAQTGKLIGPLHGLPISLKDNFQISGVDSSVGFVGWINDPQTTESTLVEILREQGAIFHCKTNISTAMMMAESYNNVWGRTLNPFNRNLSAGGSSGGEGALLAMKGSPLGVGTDIGGSIRIPSSWNLLYALKPSLGRFPTYAARSGMAGQEAVASVNGPMSTSLSALELYASTVIAGEPWLRDPKVIPLPWRNVELPEKLCIGVVYDDGMVRPNPPITRALQEAVAKLEAAGHTIIPWTDEFYPEAVDLLESFFLSDGGETIRRSIELSGEDWPSGLSAYKNASGRKLDCNQLWQLQLRRTKFVKRFMDKWNATAQVTGTERPMDAILSPATAFAACLHDKWDHVAYTCIYNITDCSAATFPVFRADSEIDVEEATYVPRNEVDKRVWEQYDAKAYHGGPVSLQLAARKMEEEKLLKMLKVVSEVVQAPL